MVRKQYEGLYFYFKNDMFYYITDTNSKEQTIEPNNNNKKMKNYHWVSKNIFVGYEDDNNETLIRFRNDYNIWIDEISETVFMTENDKPYRINLKNYKKIKYAIYKLVLNFSKISEKEFENLVEPLDRDEFLIHKNCYNAGIMSVNTKEILKPVKTFGYDFSSNYPELLSRLIIPKKRGMKTIMKELNYDKLAFGIYRVKITYTNNSFPVIFSFSDKHHYTSLQLKTIYKHREQLGLKFELLEPDEDYSYNAYIYPSEFLELKTVYAEWLKSMKEIKTKCSKTNQLIKMIVSSVWGVFTETYKLQIEENDLENYDCETDYYYKEMNEKGHILIDFKNISLYGGFYRIKTFLTASQRNFMLSYAIKNNITENILRIHTDSYMLNKEVNFRTKLNKTSENKILAPKPEDKSTGLIKIYNAQRYFHICGKCSLELKYKDYLCHTC